MDVTNRVIHVTVRFFLFFCTFYIFELAERQNKREKGMKMKKNGKGIFITGCLLIAAFTLWTWLIQNVDVQPVGQNGTNIGFAGFNCWFHKITGVHMTMYVITDWLGLVPIAVCILFGIVGLCQVIQRRSLLKVDCDILVLGIYYMIVIFAYLIFEMIPINYRPILIEGVMEVSYPSSTTLLVLSVMPTFCFQINRRLNNMVIKRVFVNLTIGFSVFMVIGRLISGVHWFSDIVGAVLFSTGMFRIYKAVVMLGDKE